MTKFLDLPGKQQLLMYHPPTNRSIYHPPRQNKSSTHKQIYLSSAQAIKEIIPPGHRLWWRKPAGYFGHLGSPANNIENFPSSVQGDFLCFTLNL